MPEDWDRQLAVFAESLVVLPQLVEGVEPNRLHRSPAPGEWSAHVVVSHLVLNEMNTAMSLRLILTRDSPVLAEIEDDQCAAQFAPLYPDTPRRSGRARPARGQRPPLRPQCQPTPERGGRPPWRHEGISFRDYVASRGRHDRVHIDQIRSALSG